MSFTNTEYVYLGTDERLDVGLLRNGEAEDLSGVTKISLYLSSAVAVHSDVEPEGTFDWDTGEQGKIIMKLGLSENIPIGVYPQVRLRLYSVAKPNGEMWTLPFQIVVEELPE